MRWRAVVGDAVAAIQVTDDGSGLLYAIYAGGHLHSGGQVVDVKGEGVVWGGARSDSERVGLGGFRLEGAPVDVGDVGGDGFADQHLPGVTDLQAGVGGSVTQQVAGVHTQPVGLRLVEILAERPTRSHDAVVGVGGGQFVPGFRRFAAADRQVAVSARQAAVALAVGDIEECFVDGVGRIGLRSFQQLRHREVGVRVGVLVAGARRA